MPTCTQGTPNPAPRNQQEQLQTMALFTSYSALEKRTAEIFGPVRCDAMFDLVRRARAILSKRSTHEINAAWRLSQELTRKSGDLADDIVCDLWAHNPDSLSRYSPPRLLFLTMDGHDIHAIPGFPKATWAEIFAVVALRFYTAFLTKLDGESIKKPEQVSASAQPETVTYIRLIDTLEAVTLAESLDKEPLSMAIVRQEIQAKLRTEARPAKVKAAYTRHAPTDRLLKDLEAFYDNGGYSQYSKAVADFLEATPPARYQHLKKTNIHRTLRENLSAIKKGKRPRR